MKYRREDDYQYWKTALVVSIVFVLLFVMAIQARADLTVVEPGGDAVHIADRSFGSGEGLTIVAPESGEAGAWVIERCTFRTPRQGLVLTSRGATIEHVTIRDCIFIDESEEPGPWRIGLNAGTGKASGRGLTIENCTFRGWRSGIDFQQSGHWDDVRVIGNRVRGSSSWAMRLYHVFGLEVRGNVVDDCGSGIWINSPNSHVIDNRVTDTLGAGLALNVGHGSILRGNYTRGNDVGLWVTTTNEALVSDSIHRDGFSLDAWAEFGQTTFPNRSTSFVRFSDCILQSRFRKLLKGGDKARAGVAAAGSF